MEIIEHKKVVESTYNAYVPDCVRKTIEYYGNTMPIMSEGDEGFPSPSIYKIENMSVECAIWVRLDAQGVKVPLDAEGPLDAQGVKVPLAMCNYVRPAGDYACDLEKCRECDMTNVVRERHNKFLVSLLCAFMRENDCSASAGVMTAPQPPPNFAREREGHVRKIFANKYESTKKAVEYLCERKLYCGIDFAFENSIEKANDVSFEEVKARKIASGRIRVRAEGRPPSWWDGVSTTDETGRQVRWVRGENHTFLTPEVYAKSLSSTEVENEQMIVYSNEKRVIWK